jgi:hypothetical protein
MTDTFTKDGIQYSVRAVPARGTTYTMSVNCPRCGWAGATTGCESYQDAIDAGIAAARKHHAEHHAEDVRP